ncbi:hypothetical protein [Wenjunlia tyrosinilytica]|uniref:Uncharacterized protein n=1 Tax=Wenjunlia tyrosinilytica TaxID=1544741 RepID=A0A918E0M8_9ACTN|nr:hypothetical protein [Wenjunlia tyrosinilytica]GGO93698.1 hypothetical protein GCM10012280_46810 [Wenjunlia tyrosinilytica]
MLCLRVARGSRPTTLLRRLLLAAVSAGAGFLLLCALGYALAHPDRATGATARLLWCLVPAAAVVHLSVAVSRVEPSRELTAGLSATGYSSSRLPMLAAVATGFWCAIGSLLAFVAFLHLRGDLPTTSPLAPGQEEALGSRRTLPLGATLTLLALIPLLGAAASAVALRPRQIRPPKQRSKDDHDTHDTPATPGDQEAGLPSGLPWGVVLAFAGLALELYAGHWEHVVPRAGVNLPSTVGTVSTAMLIGWVVTAAGFVVAGPGLVHLCGQLIAWGRPNALRLLAGRGLAAESHRLGRPVGVLCAAAFAGLATLRLWHTSARPAIDPLTVFGAVLVAVCSVATVMAAAVESRGARRPSTATLARLGAPRSLLRRAAGLRCAALIGVLAPLTWMFAELAALPMYV